MISESTARSRIKALDLTVLRKRLMKPKAKGGCGWDLKTALKYENQYRGFLFVSWKYSGGGHIPTKNIDEYWHAHILHTKKYMKDCDHVFGRYLHHNPF